MGTYNIIVICFNNSLITYDGSNILKARLLYKNLIMLLKFCVDRYYPDKVIMSYEIVNQLVYLLFVTK